MSGCFVVYASDNRAVRTYPWENQNEREYLRQRAIDLARNLTKPSLVEEFINQPHAGTQVWASTEGETK